MNIVQITTINSFQLAAQTVNLRADFVIKKNVKMISLQSANSKRRDQAPTETTVSLGKAQQGPRMGTPSPPL